jgi:hypothetical protein
MKAVCDFIRINSEGSFERVTWIKNNNPKEGQPKLSVEKRPYKPTPIELQALINNRHAELNLKTFYA